MIFLLKFFFFFATELLSRKKILNDTKKIVYFILVPIHPNDSGSLIPSELLVVF